MSLEQKFSGLSDMTTLDGTEKVTGLQGGANKNVSLNQIKAYASTPLSGSTASRPSSPPTGQTYFNTSLLRYEYWDGTTWSAFSSGSSLARLTTPTANLFVGSDGQGTQTWGNVANEVGFVAQIATNIDFTTGLQTVFVATDILSKIWTGLVNGTTYYSRVMAIADGVNYSNSNFSAVSSDATVGAAYIIGMGLESNTAAQITTMGFLSGTQSAARTTYIVNNTTNDVEFLDEGLNGLIDHNGIADNSCWGLENVIADRKDAGDFGSAKVIVAKRGQGGSTISQWAPNGTYYNKLKVALTSAIDYAIADGRVPSVKLWITHGINDRIAGTTTTSYKTQYKALINALRAEFPSYTIPVYHTELMQRGSTWPGAIDSGSNPDLNLPYNNMFKNEMTTELTNFKVIPTARKVCADDPNHWNNLEFTAVGLKSLEYLTDTGAPISDYIPDIINTAGVLSITGNTWANSPTSYAYQWKRNGANISGATGNNYTLVPADDATNITVLITATNATGSKSQLSSAYAANVAVYVNAVYKEFSGTQDLGAGTLASGPAATQYGGDGAGVVYTINAAQDFDILCPNLFGMGSVVSINSTVTPNYAAGAPHVAWMYNISSRFYTGHTGDFNANSLDYALTGTPACRMHGDAATGDLLFYSSTDNGTTWTLVRTVSGLLAGQTNLYVRVQMLSGASLTIRIKQ